MQKERLEQYKYLTPNKPLRREYSLDILRGIAVLLMLSAHFVYFLHKGDNIFLSKIQGVGDTLAFVTFLFVSGAVTYLTLHRKKSQWRKTQIGLINRIIFLLLGYYVAAIISSLHRFGTATWTTQLFDIFTLREVPGFTEFMLPFIFYTLIYLLFPKVIKFLAENFKISVLAGIIMLIAGTILYNYQFDNFLQPYKLIFAGGEDVYRFPLLQYFFVFTMGLNLGYLFLNNQDIYKRRKEVFQYVFYSIFILIIGLVIEPHERIGLSSDFERWPPTIFFQLQGILFSLITLFLVLKRSELNLMPYLYKLLVLIGQKAYSYFLIHISLLQIYDVVWGYKSNNPVLVILLFFPFLILCMYLVKLTRLIGNGAKRQASQQTEKHVTKEKNPKSLILLNYFLIFFVVGFSIYVGFNLNPSQGKPFYEKREGFVMGDVLIKGEEILPDWWNYDFGYFRRIAIYNQAYFSTLYKDSWAEIEINHSELIKNNKSLPNGFDLRLVYYDGEKYLEIPAHKENLSSENTKIYFQLKKDLGPNQRDGNYYLYYGNKLADNINNIEYKATSISDIQKVTISPEHKGDISIATNKYWVLIDQINDANSKITLTLTQNTENNKEDASYRYVVSNTNLTGNLERVSEFEYKADVNISTLQPGIYQIQGIRKVGEEEFLSPKENFVVSYPLYIAWSMDWEGYDVKQEFLDSMDTIANKYDIPISHFFNPRIYISLEGSRAAYLTNWILSRKQSRDDSIGMHIHMFYDLVSQAGVDPYKTGGIDYDGNEIEVQDRPQWGSSSQGGYDVLTTSFSYDEMIKILEWSFQKFQENSIPTPLGFRAGGWFADTENLAAMEDAGFFYDSSGRTSYNWGSLGVTGPWNLTSTSQPYRPSRSNQNSANPPPNFGIWEFPNNGADSYSFTADQMISRFNDNLGNGVLREKRIVTYLSHPHWFNVDEPKLYSLFDYISQYLYTNDTGPVIFLNMDEAFYLWT